MTGTHGETAPPGSRGGWQPGLVLLLLGGACLLSWGFEAGPRSWFGTAAKEASSPTDFIRFVEPSPGEGVLETAVVTYRGKRGVRVDLIAAVHVADAAYYRELQRRFEAYDVLLYEMIKPAGVEPVSPGESDNLLSLFQRGLKDMLGLQFQLDAIDYRKKNFVHADLDPETFFRLQREKGETILSLMWRVFRAQMEMEASGKGPPPMNIFDLLLAFSSSDRARSLKLLLARQLEDVERLMAGFDPGDDEGGSVIVSERNKVVVAALRRALEEGRKKVGVFYGGGHMPDLERRLTRDLGFRKRRTEWVTAWDIRESPGRPEEPKEAEAAKSEAEKSEPGKSEPEPTEAERKPPEKRAGTERTDASRPADPGEAGQRVDRSGGDESGQDPSERVRRF